MRKYRRHSPRPVTTVVARSPRARAGCATRHDALSLLAVLQREARLLDFLKEPVEGYSDAQVGAGGAHRAQG